MVYIEKHTFKSIRKKLYWKILKIELMACIWKKIEKKTIFFPVNTISCDWIIWNKKIKNILLVLEILQVSTSIFFAHLIWKIFGVCLKRKNRKQKKKWCLTGKLVIKIFFFKKSKKTRRQYLINRFMKKCAKFQEDRSISFWVIVFTASRKVRFEKSCFLSYSHWFIYARSMHWRAIC